jgi:hypothetical protein
MKSASLRFVSMIVSYHHNHEVKAVVFIIDRKKLWLHQHEAHLSSFFTPLTNDNLHISDIGWEALYNYKPSYLVALKRLQFN